MRSTSHQNRSAQLVLALCFLCFPRCTTTQYADTCQETARQLRSQNTLLVAVGRGSSELEALETAKDIIAQLLSSEVKSEHVLIETEENSTIDNTIFARSNVMMQNIKIDSRCERDDNITVVASIKKRDIATATDLELRTLRDIGERIASELANDISNDQFSLHNYQAGREFLKEFDLKFPPLERICSAVEGCAALPLLATTRKRVSDGLKSIGVGNLWHLQNTEKTEYVAQPIMRWFLANGIAASSDPKKTSKGVVTWQCERSRGKTGGLENVEIRCEVSLKHISGTVQAICLRGVGIGNNSHAADANAISGGLKLCK